MKIWLFDMDGVLLIPRGYHDALQETVRRIAHALGLPHVALATEDIAAFEAAGITSEWDSAAICAALLLNARWRADPQAAWPPALEAPLPAVDVPPPDFQAFAAALAERTLRGDLPGRCALAQLTATRRYPPEHRAALEAVLGRAREIEASFTMQVFQELALGSQAYRQVYGLQPRFEGHSYLQTRDRPVLEAAAHRDLLAWLQQDGHYAAVMTARPGRWPDGSGGSPEAELGLAVTGLEAWPVVSWGSLEWLAARCGRDPQRLCKPAPVHALAAMLCSLGAPPAEALQQAAALALAGRCEPAWRRLDGSQVTVFEDTTAGVLSLLAARDLLEAHGIRLDVQAVGIATVAAKQRALSGVGAAVFPLLPDALKAVGVDFPSWPLTML